jgi:hypothetical protein
VSCWDSASRNRRWVCCLMSEWQECGCGGCGDVSGAVEREIERLSPPKWQWQSQSLSIADEMRCAHSSARQSSTTQHTHFALPLLVAPQLALTSQWPADVEQSGRWKQIGVHRRFPTCLSRVHQVKFRVHHSCNVWILFHLINSLACE